MTAGIAGNLDTSHLSVKNQEEEEAEVEAEEVPTVVAAEDMAAAENRYVGSMKGVTAALTVIGVGFRMMSTAIEEEVGAEEEEVGAEVEAGEVIGKGAGAEVDEAEEVEEAEVEVSMREDLLVDLVVIANMEIVVDVDECVIF